MKLLVRFAPAVSGPLCSEALSMFFFRARDQGHVYSSSA
jgi:hypothetical protein